MRLAEIYYKNEKAGILTQNNDGSFTFQYDEIWILNPKKDAISLTLPKRKTAFHSKHLFSFFYNILPEGTNKKAVCQKLRIDEKDYYSLLTATANFDTIGAVTVKKIEI